MIAINVQQPHAFYMFHAGKDVENRSWMPHPSKLRPGDKLAIVASKKWHEFYESGGYVAWGRIRAELNEAGIDTKQVKIRPIDFVLGGLIGVVTFKGVTKNSDSRWAEAGQYHWLLGEPVALPFMAVKGRLGLYELENFNYDHFIS